MIKVSKNPSQICQFLGLIYDSKFFLHIPKEKQISIAQKLRNRINKSQCSIEQFGSVLGQLVATCPGVNYGWVHTKRFEFLNFVPWFVQETIINQKC